jgi:glyoxylase-like metal-dependent hydrolase (beta-lactamase superfamily II)
VKNESGKLQLTFPNAAHWCSKSQWEHSKISNSREKAAYKSGVLNFLFASGKLKLVENEGNLFSGIDVRFYDGHTPGQMIPFIRYKEKTVVYTSDLIPTAANIPLLWIAAYDLYPVKTMKEKEKFLNEVADREYVLFFEHDFYYECATVTKNERGFQAKQAFNSETL